MPNIPNVPGVPPLLGYGLNSVALLAADIVTAINLVLGNTGWGIFLNGQKAFDYNSVVDFDYKQDWPTSDYPVEDGGFQSYDKIELPWDVRVRVASGETVADRGLLLGQIRAAAKTLNLYDVVTPEMTYRSCNITHIDYKRTAYNGVGLLMIDIWFIEVRVTSTTTYSTTQSPTTTGQQNTGSVSPQTPNSIVQQDFSDGNWSVQ